VAKALGNKPPPLLGQLDALYVGTVESTSWAVQHEFITNGDELTNPADLELVLTELFALFAKWILGPFCHVETHMHYVWGHLWQNRNSRLRVKKAGEAVGQVAGRVAPAQVATLISWETLEVRRGGHPCSYIPGVPMNHLEDDAHFFDDVAAALDTAARNYVTETREVVSGPLRVLDFVDLSYVINGAYRSVPDATSIVGATVRRVPATQRRRIDREA